MFELAASLLGEFETLFRAERPTGNRLIGTTIPSRTSDLLAVDELGAAYLLIRHDSEPRGSRWDLKSISVVPSTSYWVDTSVSPVHASYAAVVLHNDSRDLLSSFSLLAAGLFSVLPVEPSLEEIEQFLSDFRRLFQESTGPDASAVKGLWGELKLLSMGRATPDLLSCWHPVANSLYDFSSDGATAEVKTHEGVAPVHSFSHEQLIERADAWIVSMIIFSDAAGESIADLVDACSVQLDWSGRRSLLTAVIETVGPDLDAASELKYSLRRGFPQAVRASHVPRVDVPLGRGITRVQYTVDLTSIVARFGVDVEVVIRDLLQS